MRQSLGAYVADRVQPTVIQKIIHLSPQASFAGPCGKCWRWLEITIVVSFVIQASGQLAAQFCTQTKYFFQSGSVSSNDRL